MITLSGRAAQAIRARCAAAGAPPNVRVHLLGAGQPLAVELVLDTTDRPGDHLAAAHGVVVRLGRELAAGLEGHTLDAVPDDDPADPPRFVLLAPDD